LYRYRFVGFMCGLFLLLFLFFFSSRRRHTRSKRDWSSDVCSSDLISFSMWIRLFSHRINPQTRAVAISTPKRICFKFFSMLPLSHLIISYLQLALQKCLKNPLLFMLRSEERRVGTACSSAI